MDGELIIREFEKNAYDEALALWKRTPGMGLSVADERGRIELFLDCNPGLCFAAYKGGSLVGTVLCGSDTRRGYLYHLAVEPAARRSGIGRALVSRALAGLRSRGVEKCHLFLIATNELGRSFWEAEGWQERDDISIFSRSSD